VPIDHRPSTIDHRERLWDRARKIASHHLRFFSKTESDLTRSGAQRLGGTRRAKAFSLGRTMSVVGGNSEVSALREFFAT
jgi:hypothetical protein